MWHWCSMGDIELSYLLRTTVSDIDSEKSESYTKAY